MKHFCPLILGIFALLLFNAADASAQFYEENPSFQQLVVKRNQSFITTFIKQPDNKIVVLGGMDYANLSEKVSPVRLNTDGTLDESFSHSLFGSNHSAVLREDGKFVLSGLRSTEDGKFFLNLIILQSNGQQESILHTEVSGGNVSGLRNIAVQKDNKVLAGNMVLQDDSSYKGFINRVNEDGTIDPSFSVGGFEIKWISTIDVQTDGKILVTGTFTMEDGSEKTFVRLNSNGSLDNSFSHNLSTEYIYSIVFQEDEKMLVGTNLGLKRLLVSGQTDDSFTEYNNEVNSVALQADGKIIIGSFVPESPGSFNGSGQVFRLNSNGVLDNTFNSGAGAPDHRINALAVQEDGKILAGGSFTSFSGNENLGIVRLNGQDGKPDTSFPTYFGTRGHIDQLVIQEDDKALVFGDFNSANDQQKNDLVRLNINGTIDASFNTGTGVDGFWDINGGFISTVAIQDDQKLLAGGFFSSFNSTAANSLVRLNPDGSTDPDFKKFVHENYYINVLAVQKDGKVLVGGSGYFGGVSPLLMRLLPDGSVDPEFLIFEGITNLVSDIIIQEDGKILIAGNFTSTPNTPASHIVRLHPDGSVDETFKTAESDLPVKQISLQQDGKILALTEFKEINFRLVNFLTRINSDGSLDDTFNPDLGNGHQLESFILQPDGQIFVNGFLFEGQKKLILLKNDGSLNEDLFILDSKFNWYSGMALHENKLFVFEGNKLIQLYTRKKQEITFNPVSDKQAGDAPFTLEATASSGLPVTFTLVSGPASVDGNTVTLTGAPGTVTIRASQAGDDDYGMAEFQDQSFEVTEPLGTKDNQLTGIKIYPNPAMDYIFVESLIPVGKTDIQLFDLMGKRVYPSVTLNSSGLRIDCQDMRHGMYFLHLLNGNKTYSQKVILK